MRIRFASFALAFVLPVCTSAHADDLMIRRRVTTTGGLPEDIVEYTTDRKAISDDGQTRTIVDFDAKTITTIDTKARTYWTISFDELRHQKEEMATRFKQLPPAVRDAMGLDRPPVVIPTGRTEEIAGHDADEYRVDAGPITGVVWATDEVDPPDAADEWKRLAGPGEGPLKGLAQAMAKIKGLPLRTVTTIGAGDERSTTTDEVLEIDDDSPPADLLKIPDDYKKVAQPTIQTLDDDEDDGDDDGDTTEPAAKPTPTPDKPAEKAPNKPD
jgi:hypothetical protein